MYLITLVFERLSFKDNSCRSYKWSFGQWQNLTYLISLLLWGFTRKNRVDFLK